MTRHIWPEVVSGILAGRILVGESISEWRTFTFAGRLVYEAPLELVQVRVGLLTLQCGMDVQHIRVFFWRRIPQVQGPPDLQIALAIEVGGLDEAGVVLQGRVQAQEVCWKQLLVLHLQNVAHPHIAPLDILNCPCRPSRPAREGVSITRDFS